MTDAELKTAGLTDVIVDILRKLEPLSTNHTGQPYMTAYQLALKVREELANGSSLESLVGDVPPGGAESGASVTLARTIAGYLTRQKPEGVEIAFLHGEGFHNADFGNDITSSTPYLSLFRWKMD